MATKTIERPVETGKYDDVRRLVDGPEPIKRVFFSKLAAQPDGVRELRIIAAADQQAAAVSLPTQPATPHRYGFLAGLVARLGSVFDWLAGPAATQQERDQATLVAAQAVSKGSRYL